MFRPTLDLDQEFPYLGTASPSPPAPASRLSLAQSKSYAAASSSRNPYGYYAGGDHPSSRKLTRNDFPALSTSSSNTATSNNSSSMVSPWNNGYPSSILEQQDSNEFGKHGGSKSSNEQQPWVSRAGNTLKLTQPMQPPLLRSSSVLIAPASTIVTHRQVPPGSTTAAAPQQYKTTTGNNNTEKSTHHAACYGLLGLIDVIQRKSPDKSMLGLGTDLATLGLDLNSPEEIYPSFLSPWSETNVQSQIAQQTNNAIQYGYYLPPSYRSVTSLRPAYSRMHVLSDEILLYTFYCMARDELQDAAAQELFGRGWRYHKELGVWLTREKGGLLEATVTSNEQKKCVFVSFDPDSWQKKQREFTISWDVMEMKREKVLASYASSITSSPAVGDSGGAGIGSTTSTQL